MGAMFADLAMVQHQHPITLRYRLQPMRNDDGGPAFHDPAQRLLNHQFSHRIDARRRLVEHKNLRVRGEHPRKRE